jgi:hypothetical protein
MFAAMAAPFDPTTYGSAERNTIKGVVSGVAMGFWILRLAFAKRA